MTQENQETYNGWSNRETWLVNLWLTNDEGLYRETLDKLETGDQEGQAKVLEDFVDELIERHSEVHSNFTGFIGDLLVSALARVHWQEIVSSFMGD